VLCKLDGALKTVNFNSFGSHGQRDYAYPLRKNFSEGEGGI
jgi:hypothetical protein